ncbi:MAG: thiamine pyrophosphate-binding protein [Candidatus Gastranaerophilales bacterium]|nr:thiamine pyrophosphate-binding protein [Candidatus Gastranaerophilales bacterium]
MIKLSDYIAKRLKEVYKIKYIFMVSGGGAMHLNDSFGRYIPYICCHHEQACAIAAEGYAKVNHELAVVNVTTGSGGLNCLNGVFGQWTDSVPVLYISGQVKNPTLMASYPDIKLRQLGEQETDIISAVKHITKYAVTVTNPNEIKFHLDKAIYNATTQRMGPVWLDIPMDVQSAVIDEENLIEFIPPENPEYDCKISKVVNYLKSAKRPVIVAGNGIKLSNQTKCFYEMLENTNIPVLLTFNGIDILPSNHKNYFGRIGTVGQRAANFILQNADVVLFLGTRNNIRQISYNWKNFAKNAFKIAVDIDKAELEKPTLDIDLKINADLKAFLPQLKDSVSFNTDEHWITYCTEVNQKYTFENTKEYQSQDGKINVYDFVHKLTDILPSRNILVCANGSASVCTMQIGVIKKQQHLIWNSGNASMGYDLPASIGAYYASGRNIVCLAGDGSIMMNLQELETIVYNNIPIKIFVINNAGYSSLRQTQRNYFGGNLTASGESCGVGIPNFSKIASAIGIKSVRVANPASIEFIIKSVLQMNCPVICEVMTETEYSFTPKLSSIVLDDGTMMSPHLEDMSPFLSKEEYNQNMLNEKDKRW